MYVAINGNTQGIQDKISMIKLFHYVNNTKGYLIEVEYSSNNFILPISGNNASNPISLDFSGMIPYYEPEPEPELEILRIEEALSEIINPNAPISEPYTYILYISPIIGNVNIGDVIAIYVGNENRGQSSVSSYNNLLFSTINVNTQGISDEISKIKLFHYVNSIEGYLIEIDYSSKNYSLPINGNNASDWVRLDYSGMIPEYESSIILLTLEEALSDIVNPNGNISAPETFVLYISPIYGGVNENDVIAIFVGNENRGQSVVNRFDDSLFAAINVNTLGVEETISSIKIFHYMDDTKGVLISIDYSLENFTLPINSSNVSSLIELNVNGLLPDSGVSEPEPELELYTISEALGVPVVYTYTPFTFFVYPISGNNVKIDDVIGIYVGEENRAIYSSAIIKEHPTISNTLFAAINVSTSGMLGSPEIVSKIKVFHYVTETKGYISEMDISTLNYEIVQGSSNVNELFELNL